MIHPIVELDEYGVPRMNERRIVPPFAISAAHSSVAALPRSFRQAASAHPDTGFFEWQKRADGKQPYRFRREDLEPFAFCRMPVILKPQDYRWLDAATPADELRSILKPLPAERMQAEAVSRAVNSVKYDNEECIAPIGEPALVPSLSAARLAARGRL